MGTHLRLLNDSYLMNTNMIGLDDFQNSLHPMVVLLMNIASALEGFILWTIQMWMSLSVISAMHPATWWKVHKSAFNSYAAGGKFGKYKMVQKTWKMAETLAYGYSSESTQWELSNEYQHDMVSRVFKNICVFVLWRKVASALEGFSAKLIPKAWIAPHFRNFLPSAHSLGNL